jgi:hypothetical protein
VILPVPTLTESVATESPPTYPAPADPAPAESPPVDLAPAESSAEPLHSAAGATPIETSLLYNLIIQSKTSIHK